MEQLTVIEGRGQGLAKDAGAILVTDAPSYRVAANFLLAIKAYRIEVAATFDPIIQKAHEAHKEALAQKQVFERPAETAEKIVKRRMGDWQAAEERRLAEEARRLEAQARADAEDQRIAEAAAAEQAGRSEEARALLDAPIFTAPVIAPPAAPKIAGISIRNNWTFLIEDATKIPREFLMVDTVKIRAHVRAWKAEARIPGVRVYDDRIISGGTPQ